MNYHVYVSNGGSKFFSKFVLDEASLSQEKDIPLDDCAGTVATTADGGLMFVCLRSVKQLESFRVDRKSGLLSSRGRINLEEAPPYVKTDNTDRFLLSAYYTAGLVMVHGIGADGLLSAEPLQRIAMRNTRTAFRPTAQIDSPTCRTPIPPMPFISFVSTRRLGCCRPINQRRFNRARAEGPRHFAFSPGQGCPVFGKREWLYSQRASLRSRSRHLGVVPGDFNAPGGL